MPIDLSAILGAAVPVAVGLGLGEWFRRRKTADQDRKEKGKSTVELSDHWSARLMEETSKIREDLREENAELRQELLDLKVMLAAANGKIKRLEQQVVQLGAKPVNGH